MSIAEEVNYINQSIHQISQSDSPEEIMDIFVEALKRSGFYTFQFSPENGSFQLSEISFSGVGLPVEGGQITLPKLTVEKLVQDIGTTTKQLSDPDALPGELRVALYAYGCLEVVLLPMYQNGRLNSVYILGSQQTGKLTALTIQPYASLTAFTSTVLEKIQTTQRLNRRVAALQSLAKISQAISVVTELNELFAAIHEQVIQVIGEVDLAIALYDPLTNMISIPYAHEAGENIHLETFPLGEGLTSILIRTQQPLMLVEDTERKALELGAKIAGASAKSWLGVPLAVANEVIGAFILQDIFNEHRFDDDDLRLMTTLASQLAVTIRNVRLLQDAQRRAEMEKTIAEITSKIWASQDIETIARTALFELGRAVQASSGRIYITSPNDSPSLEEPYEPIATDQMN
jgi:GAF domain-containing protein